MRLVVCVVAGLGLVGCAQIGEFLLDPAAQEATSEVVKSLSTALGIPALGPAVAWGSLQIMNLVGSALDERP